MEQICYEPEPHEAAPGSGSVSSEGSQEGMDKGGCDLSELMGAAAAQEDDDPVCGSGFSLGVRVWPGGAYRHQALLALAHRHLGLLQLCQGASASSGSKDVLARAHTHAHTRTVARAPDEAVYQDQ